jgi:hypothetical protein
MYCIETAETNVAFCNKSGKKSILDMSRRAKLVPQNANVVLDAPLQLVLL